MTCTLEIRCQFSATARRTTGYHLHSRQRRQPEQGRVSHIDSNLKVSTHDWSRGYSAPHAIHTSHTVFAPADTSRSTASQFRTADIGVCVSVPSPKSELFVL